MDSVAVQTATSTTTSHQCRRPDLLSYSSSASTAGQLISASPYHCTKVRIGGGGYSPPASLNAPANLSLSPSYSSSASSASSSSSTCPKATPAHPKLLNSIVIVTPPPLLQQQHQLRAYRVRPETNVKLAEQLRNLPRRISRATSMKLTNLFYASKPTSFSSSSRHHRNEDDDDDDDDDGEVVVSEPLSAVNVADEQIGSAPVPPSNRAAARHAPHRRTTTNTNSAQMRGCMPSTRQALKRSVSFLEPLRLSRANSINSWLSSHHQHRNHQQQQQQHQLPLWDAVLASDIVAVRLALLQQKPPQQQYSTANIDEPARDGFTLADMALLLRQPPILQLLLNHGLRFSQNIEDFEQVEERLTRLVDDAYQKFLYFSRLHETKLEMRGWKASSDANQESELTRIRHWQARHEQFIKLLSNWQQMRQPQAPTIADAIATSPFSMTVRVNTPSTSSLVLSLFSSIVVEVAHSPNFGASSQSAIVARVQQRWTGASQQTFHISNLPEESRYFVRAAVCTNTRCTSSWCYMFEAVTTIPWYGSTPNDYINMLPAQPPWWPDWPALSYAIDNIQQRLACLQQQRAFVQLTTTTTFGESDGLPAIQLGTDSTDENKVRVSALKRRPSFSDNVRTLFGVHPLQTNDILSAQSGLYIISLVVDASGKRIMLANKHSPPAILVDGTTSTTTTTSPASSSSVAPTTLHILNLLSLGKWQQTRSLYTALSATTDDRQQQHGTDDGGQQQQRLSLLALRRNLLKAVCTLQTMLDLQDLGSVHHQLLSVGERHGAYAVVLIRRQIRKENEKNSLPLMFARFRQFDACSLSVRQLLCITSVIPAHAMAVTGACVDAPKHLRGLCLIYFDTYVDGANIVVKTTDGACDVPGEAAEVGDAGSTTPMMPFVQIRAENSYLNENDWRDLCELLNPPPTTGAQHAGATRQKPKLPLATADSYSKFQVEFLKAYAKLLQISTPPHSRNRHVSAVYVLTPLILNDQCTAIVVAPAAAQQHHHQTAAAAISLQLSQQQMPTKMPDEFLATSDSSIANARFVPLQLLQLNLQSAVQPNLMRRWSALLLQLETYNCIARVRLLQNNSSKYLLSSTVDDINCSSLARQYVRELEELRITLLQATQTSVNFLAHLLASFRQQHQQQQQLLCQPETSASMTSSFTSWKILQLPIQ